MSNSKTTKRFHICKTEEDVLDSVPSLIAEKSKPFITDESPFWTPASSSQFSDIIWIRTTETNVFMSQMYCSCAIVYKDP